MDHKLLATSHKRVFMNETFRYETIVRIFEYSTFKNEKILPVRPAPDFHGIYEHT